MLRPGDVAPQWTLHPIMGLPVDMTRAPTVLLFVRPLEGSSPRVTVNRLQEAWPRFFADGIQVAAITRCDLTFARDFFPRYHVLFPLVVDETGEYFQSYDVGSDRGFVGTLKGLGPSAFRTLRAGLRLGRARWGMPSAQLPAEFVVAPDGTVRYAHYATSVLEQPDIEALWNAAHPS